MDRALYVALSGAIATQRAQTANTNNLANANSTGFRGELVLAQAVNVDGPGFQSRVNNQLSELGWDSSHGAIIQTDRDLDVALRENNWLAVQAADGTEAYTKAGDLQVDVNGQLRTRSGQPVIGDAGPLTIPPNSRLTIGSDGTISVLPQGAQGAATLAVVGRLRVVTAQPAQLQRREDGLFRAIPGQPPLAAAAGDVLNSGALEGSNVNLASSLVNMIQLARQFELQVKVLRTAEDNASASNSLVRIN